MRTLFQLQHGVFQAIGELEGAFFHRDPIHLTIFQTYTRSHASGK